jgi:His/Glu/Gln/Arg/opine family amino acid ABC transporter permease subunit
MDTIISYMPLILKGTSVTISVSIASILLAVLLGLLGAWAKLSNSRVAQAAAGAYTTLVRGVPDLVLMLLIFYGGQQLLNNLGTSTGLWGYLEIDQFTAGFMTIGFIFGAYMTETFRGAYLAIPRGEIEAGIACGMSAWKVFSRVVWWRSRAAKSRPASPAGCPLGKYSPGSSGRNWCATPSPASATTGWCS